MIVVNSSSPPSQLVVVDDVSERSDADERCVSCFDSFVWFTVLVFLGAVASLPWSMILSLYQPNNTNMAMLTVELSQLVYIVFCVVCSRVLAQKARFRRRISFSLLSIGSCLAAGGIAQRALSTTESTVLNVFTVVFLTLLVLVSLQLNFELFSISGIMARRFVCAPIIGLNITGVVTTLVDWGAGLNIVSSVFLFSALLLVHITCALFIYATKLKPYTSALRRHRAEQHRQQQQEQQQSEDRNLTERTKRVSFLFSFTQCVENLIKFCAFFFKKRIVMSALACLIGTFCLYTCAYPYFFVSIHARITNDPQFLHKCATLFYVFTLVGNLFPVIKAYEQTIKQRKSYVITGLIAPLSVLTAVLACSSGALWLCGVRIETQIYSFLVLMATLCGYLAKLNLTIIHKTCGDKTLAMVSASCAISVGTCIGTYISWFLADCYTRY